MLHVTLDLMRIKHKWMEIKDVSHFKVLPKVKKICSIIMFEYLYKI